MKRDFLKGLGLEDSIIDQIMAENGKDIESHKSKLTTAETERDQVKAQLNEASKQIENFKTLDVEGIKKAADDYKAQLEKSNAEHQTQIAQMRLDYALDGKLKDAKAKNPTLVKKLLDLTTLKHNEEDGSIAGLDEQLNTIKTENDYLFESEDADIKIVTGGKSKSVIGDPMIQAARKAAGLPTE